MITKLKRKRVKIIKLINSKAYDNATLKVKWCLGCMERSWGLNRGMEKHRACTVVSLHGSSCVKQRSSVLAACAALTSPSCKWNRWSSSAAMCWQETLLFPFPHSGCSWPLIFQAPPIQKHDISKADLLPSSSSPTSSTSGRGAWWEPVCSWFSQVIKTNLLLSKAH